MSKCLTLLWQVTRKTRRLLSLFRVLLMKSASQSSLTNHQILILKSLLKSRTSALRMLRKHLTQTTKMFVMRLFFLFMTQFMRSLTSSLRATRARLTRLCILFKSMLFVLGSRMSTRELTAEVLTRFVLLMPKSTFFQEFTVQVCSQEVKHRYFQLQHSVL